MSPRSTHQRMRKPPPRDESKWPYQRSVRCSSTHRSQRFSHCKQVNRKLLSAISAAFPETRLIVTSSLPLTEMLTDLSSKSHKKPSTWNTKSEKSLQNNPETNTVNKISLPECLVDCSSTKHQCKITTHLTIHSRFERKIETLSPSIQRKLRLQENAHSNHLALPKTRVRSSLPERREEHIVSRLLLQKVAKFRTSFVQRAFYPIPHRDRNHLQPHCVPRITWYTHQRTRRFVGLCSYRRWKHTNPTSCHLCALNKTTPANPEKTTTGGSRYSTRPLLRWLGGGRHGGVSQSPKPHQQTREPNFLCP